MAITEVCVPDVGGAESVDVIEVLVKVGDTVAVDQGLITLESDKASMDVPTTVAGVVKSIHIKVGDKVKQGSKVATIEGETSATVIPSTREESPKVAPVAPAREPAPAPVSKAAATATVDTDEYGLGTDIHASPAVRRIAREFGVNLRKVTASGEKGRITVEDVQQYVKTILANRDNAGGFTIAPMPVIDFAQFGAIEKKSLNKIKKLTAKFLHRNWVSIPHVTQFDEADITELEEFRNQQKGTAEKQGFKLTPLVFIMKALVTALHTYPQFNASLDETGENLIYKKYFHIGVAVDTPNGLVVPVIRDVDRKTIFELAKDLQMLSAKARDGKLLPGEMQGGCISISSLGGIGGTAFTPIINAPEVAILGVSRSSMKPVYQQGTILARLMLPLSLSYDHRVIDGADGARFITLVSQCLADVRRLLL